MNECGNKFKAWVDLNQTECAFGSDARLYMGTASAMTSLCFPSVLFHFVSPALIILLGLFLSLLYLVDWFPFCSLWLKSKHTLD